MSLFLVAAKIFVQLQVFARAFLLTTERDNQGGKRRYDDSFVIVPFDSDKKKHF